MISGSKNYKPSKPDPFKKKQILPGSAFFILTAFPKKGIIHRYKKSGYAANRFQKPDWGHTRETSFRKIHSGKIQKLGEMMGRSLKRYPFKELRRDLRGVVILVLIIPL